MPSVADEAGNVALSSDDAVVVLFRAASAVPQVPPLPPEVPWTPNSHSL